MSGIDHVGVLVEDIDKSVDFYKVVLAPLGIECLMDFSHAGRRHAGFGENNKPYFWLTGGERVPGTHVCFSAGSRAEVDAFYAAAIEAGAKDNGAPGLRPHYHANYYGAFVFDPDGQNIEAVCHGPD